MNRTMRCRKRVVCAAAVAIPLCFAHAEQLTYARFDLYVVDSAFNLGQLRCSGMANVGQTPWMGEGKEKTGLSCQKKLGKAWEEIWAEFVPEGDGFVDIDLQGEWYGQKRPDDLRLVWADNVKVDGAAITNGSFEEQGPDGRPAGWRFTGDFPPDRYSRDGKVAQHAKSCVAVWYGSQARQKFPVERGKTYRVHAWFRVLDPSAVPEPPYVAFEFPFESYRQEFTVTFKTEAAARKASVRMTPLYNGYEWAVSSRWDDNNPEDIKMRDVLTKHGHKGTFYLNSLWPDWSPVTTKTDSQFGRDLLKGGHTIGCHSLTHPLLSYCSRNRIFEEVAGDRIVWEAAADTLVNSYSFSYCNFINPQEGLAVQADIARCLERGGFYNIASEPSFEELRADLILSPIMPSDGADIDGWAQAALSDPMFKEQHPNLTYSMHVWYRTPEAWAKFEKQLDDYGHRPDWWYCNQNEYAAYRYQFLRSRLSAPVRTGNRLRFSLVRPVMIDLNDPVPVSFRVGGVPRESVAAVHCATAACTPSDRDAAAYTFHLHHGRDQALPKKVGMVPPNTQNRATLSDNDMDVDFRGLKSLLHFDEGKLHLQLDNQGPDPMTKVRVTYRLPLAWKEGVSYRRLKDIPAGARREDAFAPTLVNRNYKFNSGNHFFIAQIDFLRGEERGRLYASCRWKSESVDASYPQGGFLRLGPIPNAQFDLNKVTADIIAAKVRTQPWVLNDETRVTWQSDDSPFHPPYLDVELICLSGQWFAKEPGIYVVQSNLRSDREQQVELGYLRGSYQSVILNGEEVSGKSAVQLRAGDNRLFLICGGSTGAFLRVLKPGTQDRVTDIHFERPKETSTSDLYVCATPGPARRKTLAGKWRAKMTLKLSPSPSIQSPHPEPGMTPEAKQLAGQDVDDSAWEELEVPKRWKDYPGDWPNMDGEAVFRREVNIPEEWIGKALMLSLGPIDDFDDTYFNGTLVGRTDETVPNFYSAPRLYTIPANLVRPGRNLLAVRMFDHFGDGGFTGEALEMFIAPKG